MAQENSFDNLVSEISKDERTEILNKINNATSVDNEDTFEPIEETSQDIESSLSEQLRREPLVFRFFIWLKSVFTNNSQEVLFNEVKVSNMSRNLQKNYSGLLDFKKGLLLSLFYDKVADLKKVADFFKPYIASIEQDDAGFYVYLGAVMMPNVIAEINENADPYSNPVSKDVHLELRVELVRNMENIFQNILPDSKQGMYEAVKSIEWLKQFVRLPFVKLLSYFTEVTDNIHTCQFSQVENEVAAFAKILCNSFKLSEKILESIYNFSSKNLRKSKKIDDMEDKFANDFMNKAKSNISILHMFMSSVPMYSINCVVSCDSRWQVEKFTGGEDWFVKFKAGFKKSFEQKWEAWVLDCKKENLRENLKSNFELERYPLLPNRPWTTSVSDIKFKYELTAGFLYWYFLEKFPKSYELTLKSIMVEGSFKKKENQTAFTDSFNELIQISIGLNSVNERLKPSGDVGASIAHFQNDDKSTILTLQEQSKIEQLMRSIESDIKTILHRFGDSVRNIDMILCGILGLKKDPKYDSLSNLNRIQGRGNEEFLKNLYAAQRSLSASMELIKELEGIDSPKSLDS